MARSVAAGLTVVASLAVGVTFAYVSATDQAAIQAVPASQSLPGTGNIKVEVDPRMELIAVVQLLSGYGEQYGLTNQLDFPYRRNVDEHFEAYNDHGAVKLFNEMCPEGFNYGIPPVAVLHLSDPPGLDIVVPFTENTIERAGGTERLTEFVRTLRDFTRETRFVDFYEANRESLQRIEETVRDAIGSVDYVGMLENYYGMSQNSYTVIPAPLFRPGYGPRVERDDGTFDLYCIIGPRGVDDQGTPEFAPLFLRYVILHEFSHSFVNPLTAKYSEEIAKYSALFEPIAGQMKEQAYGEWETCVNEHVVRAVQIRLTGRQFGSLGMAMELADAKSRGFIYIEPLCERLKQFEEQRDKYPTFEAFYPQIIDVFRELSGE